MNMHTDINGRMVYWENMKNSQLPQLAKIQIRYNILDKITGGLTTFLHVLHDVKNLSHVLRIIFIDLNKLHHEFELIVVTLIFFFAYFIFVILQPFWIFFHNVFHGLMKNLLGQKLLHHCFNN